LPTPPLPPPIATTRGVIPGGHIRTRVDGQALSEPRPVAELSPTERELAVGTPISCAMDKLSQLVDNVSTSRVGNLELGVA
jgi:hypothetical protein